MWWCDTFCLLMLGVICGASGRGFYLPDDSLVQSAHACLSTLPVTGACGHNKSSLFWNLDLDVIHTRIQKAGYTLEMYLLVVLTTYLTDKSEKSWFYKMLINLHVDYSAKQIYKAE